MELSLLTHRAGQIPGGERMYTNLSNEIRLLPDITFTCPTVITSLALGIEVRDKNDIRNRYPSVLLARPIYNSTKNTIGYTVEDEQAICYTPDNVSTNGMYNYPLDPPISVNVGDIVGVRAPMQEESVVLMYYDQMNRPDYITKKMGNSTDNENEEMMTEQLVMMMEQLVLLYPIVGELQ